MLLASSSLYPIGQCIYAYIYSFKLLCLKLWESIKKKKKQVWFKKKIETMIWIYKTLRIMVLITQSERHQKDTPNNDLVT